MTFLYRALSTRAEGTAEFRDVPKNAYYADAVAWAAANGITTGIGGGLFGPDNDCTRAQIVTFLPHLQQIIVSVQYRCGAAVLFRRPIFWFRVDE